MERVHAYFHSKKCTITTGTLDFLHMRVKTTPNGIEVDMTDYIVTHLDTWGVQGTAPFPAQAHLFDVSENSPPATDPKRYTSIVMALMYCATRTRPDILLALSFLATRCNKSTTSDEAKLDTLLRYLRYTSDLKLTLSPTNMNVSTYADASYNVHHDAKGHSGHIITIGQCGALIAAKSSKQKVTSKSSCEAELISADLSTATTIQAAATLAEFGFDIIPTLYQDNEGTIELAHSGHNTQSRSRHINTRFFHIKGLIESNQLDVQHIRTANMTADVLTKPLTGSKFIQFRNQMMNIDDTNTIKTSSDIEGVCTTYVAGSNSEARDITID